MKQPFKKKFSIPFIFTWLILVVFFTTPVFPMEDGSDYADYDEGIFSDVVYSEAAQYLAQTEEILSSKIVRSRLVRIDFNRLFKGIGKDNLGKPEKQSMQSDKPIHFNLFFDVDFHVRIEKVVNNSSGSITWIGKDMDTEMSQVIFTVKDGIMIGSFLKNDKSYIIRYVGGGIHDIQETDHSRYEGCEEPAIVNPTEMLDEGITDGVSSPQANTRIDVMVVYTATARSAAGGTTAMQNLIDQGVAESNVGYSNSAIAITLVPVHTAEVSYSESGFNWGTCLSRLVGTSDGYMDNVHSLRDTYGADVVVMIVNNYDKCGQASAIMATASQAFCLVSRTCVTGHYSFAHEIGHLQGARHDRYVDNTDDSPFDYNHGRTYPAGAWRTVMAYNNACSAQGVNCTRINYWSNPGIYYSGVATGISGGAGVGADNHLCLNNTRAAVANFRTSTQTVSFPCLADTFVRQDDPNANFGSSTLLRSRGSATGHGIHPFLKFTVSGVTRPIQSAKLRIRTQTAFPVCVVYHMTDNTWQEYTLTWNTRKMGYYSYKNVGALSAYVWYEFDVSNFVTGNTTYTFYMAASDVAGQAFYSRQSSYKPTLIVTY